MSVTLYKVSLPKCQTPGTRLLGTAAFAQLEAPAQERQSHQHKERKSQSSKKVLRKNEADRRVCMMPYSHV